MTFKSQKMPKLKKYKIFFDEVKDGPKMVVRDVFLLMTWIFLTKKTCQKKIMDLINRTTFIADAKNI